MADVDTKMVGSPGGVVKKSRKSKAPTPIYRTSPLSNGRESVESPIRASSPVKEDRASPAAAATAFKPPTSVSEVLGMVKKSTEVTPLINGAAAVAGPAASGGAIRSYSDFMRSLAAKYNNNEYYPPTSTNPMTDPLLERSIKATGGAAGGLNPFLGLQGFGLGSLVNPYQAKDQALGTTQPSAFSFPPAVMEQLSSAQQALLSFAARSASQPSQPRPPVTSSEAIGSPAKQPRPREGDSPLDLSGSPLSSSSPPPRKRSRPSSGGLEAPPVVDPPSEAEVNAVLSWSVDDVVSFVESIELCKEYAEVFREHSIDGSTLSLLTDDHLTKRLGMKLGPALKLRSSLVKKMGALAAVGGLCAHCAHCQALIMRSKSSPPPRHAPSD